MAKRLNKWFTYTVLFALIPLLVVLALRALHGTLTVEAMVASPELLFVTLMLGATALGDISAAEATEAQWVKSVLLLGTVWSAVCYGTVMTEAFAKESMLSTHAGVVLVCESVLATTMLVLGTVAQWLTEKAETATLKKAETATLSSN